MLSEKKTVYPYIPNSAPAVQKEMMEAVGVGSLMELYEEIPDHLRFKERLDIPPAIADEFSLKRHTERILSRNKNCKNHLSFLGAGCAQHFIPAVVDEITSRGEFLTCYGAESWADHGKYQTFFEYNSMLAELLGTEVMSVPQYDGAQAVSTALCMANRINNRQKVLLPELMNPQIFRVVRNYLASVEMQDAVEIVLVACDPQTGRLNLADLKAKLNRDISAVLIENPGYLGVLETEAAEIGRLAKAAGAEFVVYTDPISLGVLEAPANYGATIVCGDLHSLGLHLLCGNGQAGFISTQGEAKYLNEYKDFIYGLAEPEVPGEYVFGNMMVGRTHYAQRAKGREYTGTGTNLWMISAAVYLACMGPQGMEDVGETILSHSRYAAQKLAELPGVRLQFDSPLFQEVAVNFDETGKTVAEINKALLQHEIFGGLDLSADFPQLGQSALYCVTEITGKEEIERLVTALRTVLAS